MFVKGLNAINNLQNYYIKSLIWAGMETIFYIKFHTLIFIS
jgi:hypothetical protein